MSRYSEAIIYINIFGDMGESNDYINGILLENIDKEIPISFSLPAIPAKDIPSVSKSSTTSKLENYIDENYDEAAKIQLKQANLREVKQQLTCETKEKGHLHRLPCSLRNQVSSLKIEIGYLREEMKKNNVIRTLMTLLFTKLTKQKSRLRDIQTDRVIQEHPDERTHLTNTEVTSSNINKMRHVVNKENPPPDKERDNSPPPSQNPTNPPKSMFIVGDSMIQNVDGYLLTNSLKHQYLVKKRPFSTAKTIDMYDYIKSTQKDFTT